MVIPTTIALIQGGGEVYQQVPVIIYNCEKTTHNNLRKQILKKTNSLRNSLMVIEKDTAVVIWHVLHNF